MIVSCEFDFCVYNRGHKCIHDEIRISIGGLCDMAVNRINVRSAVEAMQEEGRLKKARKNNYF